MLGRLSTKHLLPVFGVPSLNMFSVVSVNTILSPVLSFVQIKLKVRRKSDLALCHPHLGLLPALFKQVKENRACALS